MDSDITFLIRFVFFVFFVSLIIDFALCLVGDIKKLILIKKGKLLMREYKIKYSIDGETYERVLRDASLICCLNEFLEKYPEVHVFECEEINL